MRRKDYGIKGIKMTGMICIIGKTKISAGFNLAGIKKTYRSLNDIKDENIILIEKAIAEKEKDLICQLEKDRIIIELPQKIDNKTIEK